MKFPAFDTIPSEEWDALVMASPDGWLYQTHAYIADAAAQGNRNLSFALMTDTNEMLGICPIYLTLDTRYSRNPIFRFFQRAIMFFLRRMKIQGPWDYRILSSGFSGPALSPRLGAKGRRKAFKDIGARLVALGHQERVDEIQLRFTEMAEANTGEGRPGLSLLWAMGLTEPLAMIPRSAVILDLSQPLEKLRSGLDEDCRSEINRAMKEGCGCAVDPDSRVERYYHIHEISWNRTMGHAHPLSHFTDMESLLGEHMHIFLARHAEADVAGVLIHSFKDAVIYWGGCSLLEGQKVKANNYLLFEAVKWAKEQGHKWFCVGVFDAYPGMNLKEYRVGQYKAQFSSRHLEALEGRRIMSSRAQHYDSRMRTRLIKHRKAQSRLDERE